MSVSYRRFVIALAAALTGCGGDLTLPGSDSNSPVALEAFSGDGQEGTVGSRLDDPLIVKLTDARDNPVFGVPIDFQFTSVVPEAEVTPSQATTDSNGLASAEVRLGSSAGTLRVQARVVTPAALNATFVLTALERDKKKDKGGKGNDEEGDND
ncbi:MAG TPA: Ig-like domain-containing protein [Gemmatimonadales bacterium]|nr:Ig-like domain-containing protein [Gemmatimonadales bacterium]